MRLQIADSLPSTPGSSSHPAPAHHGYDNSALELDEDYSRALTNHANGHIESQSYLTGSTSIPGVTEAVQEGMTVFSDSVNPEGLLRYTDANLEYSDI